MFRLLIVLIVIIVALAAFEVDVRSLLSSDLFHNNMANLKAFLGIVWEHLQNLVRWVKDLLT